MLTKIHGAGKLVETIEPVGDQLLAGGDRRRAMLAMLGPQFGNAETALRDIGRVLQPD